MSFRVGGLVSGLDTHGLIEQLIELERKPIQSLLARGKDLEARKTAWLSISSRINNLETALTKLSGLLTDSALQAESSSDALGAKTNNDAEPGTWQVKVERLAQTRAIASDVFTAVGPGEFSFNGFTVLVEADTDLNGLVEAINVAGDSKYEFTANTEGEVTISGSYRGEGDAQLVLEAQDTDLLVYKDGELVHTFSAVLDEVGSGSVVYDGLTISFSQAQSGDSVEILSIAAAETGATASAIDGRLVLNSSTHEAIEFTDPQGVLQGIGVLDVDGNEKNILVHGNTALARINGLLVERDSNVIEDALSGVTLTLNQANDEDIQLTVARDKAAIQGNLKDIISQINALNKVLGAQGIEHDSMAYRLEDSLRRALMSSTSSDPSLSYVGAMGISSDGHGVLDLSADKLEIALSENYSGLEELLLGDKGVVESLKSACNTWTGSNGLIGMRLDTFTTQIKNNNSSLLRAEERVQMKEDQLWRRFTAMERAISTLQSQGSWLAGQLGSLPGYTRTTR